MPYLMATGSRGYHVVVPIRPVGPTSSEVRAVAFGLAEEIARRAPDRLTTEFYKSEARGPAVPRLQPQRLGADGGAAVFDPTQARRAGRRADRPGTSSKTVAARRLERPDDRPATGRPSRPVARLRGALGRSMPPSDGWAEFMTGIGDMRLGSSHDRQMKINEFLKAARLADPQRGRCRLLPNRSHWPSRRTSSRACGDRRTQRPPVRDRHPRRRRDRARRHAARRLHGHDPARPRARPAHLEVPRSRVCRRIPSKVQSVLIVPGAPNIRRSCRSGRP